MDIQQIFLETINTHNMIKRGNRVIVAVSGGPDSMCLLHLLYTHRDKLGINLCVAHLDHMFRGEIHIRMQFCGSLLQKEWNSIYRRVCQRSEYIEKTGLSPEDAQGESGAFLKKPDRSIMLKR